MPTTLDPTTFVSAVRPLLEANDIPGLVQLLKTSWTTDQIAGVMSAGHADGCKVAAVCLALVGDDSAIESVQARLVDPDPTVNQMADALWSIWFRCGSPQANGELCRGARALHDKQFHRAIDHLTAAVDASPGFAEAYNQRAIAYYLLEKYDESIADCRRAVRLMPCHFGAWAGMGHCFLHQGQLPEALKSYDRALAINPHLESLRQTADEIRDAWPMRKTVD